MVLANQGPPGKWPLKRRESVCTVIQHSQVQDENCHKLQKLFLPGHRAKPGQITSGN